MRLIAKLTVGIFIIIFLITSLLFVIQPPPEESGNRITTIATYDVMGDPVIIRYTMNQIVVTKQVRDEIELIFKDFIRQVACEEDMNHDLNVAVNLHYGFYVSMVIQITCY